MNIVWALADDVFIDDAVDLTRLKSIGSIWGSWRTWKGYGTDNVVCHNRRKARELLDTKFNNQCNFYIPNADVETLGRPTGVRLYEGSFLDIDIKNEDELVVVNLVGTLADVVLLLGFEFDPSDTDTKTRNYNGLFTHAIKSRPDVQWVLVDTKSELPEEMTNLDNLTQDTLVNVLQLLNS